MKTFIISSREGLVPDLPNLSRMMRYRNGSVLVFTSANVKNDDVISNMGGFPDGQCPYILFQKDFTIIFQNVKNNTGFKEFIKRFEKMQPGIPIIDLSGEFEDSIMKKVVTDNLIEPDDTLDSIKLKLALRAFGTRCRRASRM